MQDDYNHKDVLKAANCTKLCPMLLATIIWTHGIVIENSISMFGEVGAGKMPIVFIVFLLFIVFIVLIVFIVFIKEH